MPNPVERILGKSDSLYFKRMFARPDTEILQYEDFQPDDDSAAVERKRQVILGKLTLRRQRMATVLSTIKTEGWQMLEVGALHTCEAIERQQIWDALDKGDEAQVQSLRAAHAGLISFFSLFANLSSDIKALDQIIAAVRDNDSATSINNLLQGIVPGVDDA